MESNEQFASLTDFSENAGRIISDKVRQAILSGKTDGLENIEGVFAGLDNVDAKLGAVKAEMQYLSDAYSEMKEHIPAEVLNSWSEEQQFEFASSLAEGMKATYLKRKDIAEKNGISLSEVTLTPAIQAALDKNNLTLNEVEIYGSIAADKLKAANDKVQKDLDPVMDNFSDLDITVIEEADLPDSHFITYQSNSGAHADAYIKR